MDQAAVARRRLEAMEVWTRSLRRAATPRRRPGPGSANCWRPTWPLAAREQPRTDYCSAKQLLCLARLGFRRGSAAGIIRRTAVYGPVRTVVWEGRSRETPPYPVLRKVIGSGRLADRHLQRADTVDAAFDL